MFSQFSQSGTGAASAERLLGKATCSRSSAGVGLDMLQQPCGAAGVNLAASLGELGRSVTTEEKLAPETGRRGAPWLLLLGSCLEGAPRLRMLSAW